MFSLWLRSFSSDALVAEILTYLQTSPQDEGVHRGQREGRLPHPLPGQEDQPMDGEGELLMLHLIHLLLIHHLLLHRLLVLHLTLVPFQQDRSLVLALEECFFIAITRVIRPL